MIEGNVSLLIHQDLVHMVDEILDPSHESTYYKLQNTEQYKKQL